MSPALNICTVQTSSEQNAQGSQEKKKRFLLCSLAKGMPASMDHAWHQKFVSDHFCFLLFHLFALSRCPKSKFDLIWSRLALLPHFHLHSACRSLSNPTDSVHIPKIHRFLMCIPHRGSTDLKASTYLKNIGRFHVSQRRRSRRDRGQWSLKFFPKRFNYFPLS